MGNLRWREIGTGGPGVPSEGGSDCVVSRWFRGHFFSRIKGGISFMNDNPVREQKKKRRMGNDESEGRNGRGGWHLLLIFSDTNIGRGT